MPKTVPVHRAAQVFALAICALLSFPALAADRWTHAASGSTLPEQFEAQAIRERQDLGSPFDTVVNYEGEGLESTTVYIFRATIPRARLWFDRALPIVERQIPMNLFEPGPVEPFMAFSSAKPNALRQVFVAREPGPFKTTALVIAQSGSWIVKVRASSATLDRTGLEARIGRHLNAISFPPATGAIDLDPLPTCVRPPVLGSATPVEATADRKTTAAVSALADLSRVHDDPGASFCMADSPNARFTFLGDTRDPRSWVMLMGDSGQAIVSAPFDPSGKDKTQIVYYSTPAALRAAALFDGAPSLQVAASVVAPLMRDPKAGLFAVSITKPEPR